jgi:tetratricopeptide (TPR) repeat protein
MVTMVACVGCAIPRDHHTFSVYAPGNEQNPFLSTDELLTAGLVSESMLYGAKGRLYEAESRLRKALYLDPKNEKVQFNLAVVLGQGGNSEEALEMLSQLRGSLGDQPYLLVAIADIHNGQGDRERARTELKKAFSMYRGVSNDSQAAVIARSISNLAFAQGLEQEALCYSWEAITLAPSPQQLGAHTGLLVALNMFSEAENFTKQRIQQSPALGASVQVHYALSLAHMGRDDVAGALREVEIAQDLLAENPEIGPEVNSLWYLLKTLSPDPEDTEATLQKFEQSHMDAARLRKKPTYAIVRWPASVRELLSKVVDPA